MCSTKLISDVTPKLLPIGLHHHLYGYQKYESDKNVKADYTRLHHNYVTIMYYNKLYEESFVIQLPKEGWLHFVFLEKH